LQLLLAYPTLQLLLAYPSLQLLLACTSLQLCQWMLYNSLQLLCYTQLLACTGMLCNNWL